MISSIIFFVKIKRIKSSNEIKLPGITIVSELAFANHGNNLRSMPSVHFKALTKFLSQGQVKCLSKALIISIF